MPGKAQRLAALFDAAGLNRGLRGRRTLLLTLNYHRVADPADCVYDRELISATAAEFDEQLAFLAKHADVIDIADVRDVIAGRRRGRFVLITFDDGYADNARVAAPLLKSRGLPATFFLTSGFLDDRRAAWWDEIAWAVRTSGEDRIDLAAFGLSLDVRASRGRAIRAAVEHYKTLPASQAGEYVEALTGAAGTGRLPAGDADALWMTWEDARRLVADGFSVGGHTVSHPVLARLPIDGQREEIAGGRRRIAAELGVEPAAFSYPVGQPDSFTAETKRAVEAAGFATAFSFYGGVCGAGADPFDVPRVAVESRHDGPAFRGLASWPRLFKSL